LASLYTVILWDGGNNDVSFIKPNLHMTLVDSLRPLDEASYYPGETNVRMADMVVITKVNQLDSLKTADEHVAQLRKITKADIPIVYGSSLVTPEARDSLTGAGLLSEKEATALVEGKRVLVIDDGPTLTHGGMAYGAGYVLAKKLGASEIVDPRPYAHGTLKAVFEKFHHLKNVVPAMGYGEEQIRDLEATIKAADCDTVILGTPFDINRIMKIDKPSVIARYELDLSAEHEKVFKGTIDSMLLEHYEKNPAEAAV
jgi:predicted GTPase